MSELKPVAWSLEYNGTHVTADKSLAMSLKADGVPVTPLYAIPDGYALVPVEPTESMIDAMAASLAHSSPSTTWAEDAKKAYKAMIADAQFHKGSVVDDLA